MQPTFTDDTQKTFSPAYKAYIAKCAATAKARALGAAFAPGDALTLNAGVTKSRDRAVLPVRVQTNDAPFPASSTASYDSVLAKLAGMQSLVRTAQRNTKVH